MAEWLDIGLIDDIPMLGARVVATVFGNIAVFRTEGDAIFALVGNRGQAVHGHAAAQVCHKLLRFVGGELSKLQRGENSRIRLALTDQLANKLNIRL